MEIRKKSLAVLMGIGIAGIVGASAASLGLTSKSLGADAAVVASCDTAGGVNAAYTSSYSAALQQYAVSAVVLTNVDAACNGLAVSVTLTDGTSVLATQSGTAATGTTTINLAAPVSAEDVTNVAVVISG